jgi:undecaprenyl-diphosphatase uppP
MLEILKVIVLGIVEGFTEWLPVSSTGHLIVVEDLLKLNVSTDFKSMFNVVIQLGAILAVAFMYFNRLNPFSVRKSPRAKRATWNLLLKIFIACLPAGLLGLFLDDWLDLYLHGGYVIATMLIVYGIAFIYFEIKNKNVEPTMEKLSDIDYNTALYIGAFQVLALIPGTSRSGATILGAMILGCSRIVATEFSFFLGLPLIGAASLLKLIKFGFHYTFLEFIYLILGMAVSFVVAFVTVNFFIDWIKKHDFKAFGIYRIAFGIVVLAWYFVSSFLK